jgi:uncharacterized integral membrane protein (TIGR00698 family)
MAAGVAKEGDQEFCQVPDAPATLSRTTPFVGDVIASVLPGLALTGALTGGAYLLREVPAFGRFSPMIIAIGLGMIVRNSVGVAPAFGPGIGFAMRRLLRLAIILLGLQLTAAQVAATGGRGLAVVIVAVGATFLFTTAVGRLLGVDRPLAQLIAAGTSICGASAVAAANSVTRASDEDVAYAVACVTVFGSISMFAYPLLEGALALAPRDYGLWAGSSIHEIAQVVAATFAVGRETGEFGTVAKLTRVMMLAPVVFAMALAAMRSNGGGAATRPPLPWFVLGFVALVGFNSVVDVPQAIKANVAVLSTVLLTMALAAMGLETSFVKLRARGLRPALLGAIASLFIASLTLILIKLT